MMRLILSDYILFIDYQNNTYFTTCDVPLRVYVTVTITKLTHKYSMLSYFVIPHTSPTIPMPVSECHHSVLCT